MEGGPPCHGMCQDYTECVRIILQIGVHFFLYVCILGVKFIILGGFGSAKIAIISHTLCICAYAYLRSRQESTKKHGRYSYPCPKGSRMPAKPDKSRPCISHRRLRLIHRFCFYEFARFLGQFRITANAC